MRLIIDQDETVINRHLKKMMLMPQQFVCPECRCENGQ